MWLVSVINELGEVTQCEAKLKFNHRMWSSVYSYIPPRYNKYLQI